MTTKECNFCKISSEAQAAQCSGRAVETGHVLVAPGLGGQEEEHCKLCSTHQDSPALEPFSGNGVINRTATWMWLQGCNCESGSDSQLYSKPTYWLLFHMLQVICKIVLLSTVIWATKIKYSATQQQAWPANPQDFNSKCFPYKKFQQVFAL